MNTPPKRVKHFCVGNMTTTLKPENGHQFFEESTYHGDRDEIWIVVYNEEGKVTGKWNCRFVLGIEYA